MEPFSLTSEEESQPSNYVVLARKWRSAQFKDIVGQAHIAKTLANAVKAGRIHQAYLFTGSRGIGKTSIARIFAKVLRCTHRKFEGESWVTCDECSDCKEITAGNSVDVIEIDGASNNGVESVREIRESAKFLPSSGERKIYIIDEVHMLTTAAFNALLKTLEEPPPHIIFIFATTEPHKIPATILSRVQRFDFKRITIAQIEARLLEIASHEKISLDREAASLIGQSAEGSMRDALSLLDQVIAYSGEKVTAQSVRESIGLIESRILIEILGNILSRKTSDALAGVEAAYQAGHDLKVLTKGLIEVLHDLILLKVGAEKACLRSEDEKSQLRGLLGLRDLEDLDLIFQALSFSLESLARSSQPKITLDILVIKCSQADGLITESRESSVQSIAPPVPTPAFTPTPPPSVTPRSPAPAPAPTPTPAPKISAPVAAAPSESQTFESLISFIQSHRPWLGATLEHGHCAVFPKSKMENEIRLTFPPDQEFKKQQLEGPTYKNQLRALLDQFFGRPVSLILEITREGGGGESLAVKKERARQSRETEIKNLAQNNPVVSEAKALFGAQLGPIEIRGLDGSS